MGFNGGGGSAIWWYWDERRRWDVGITDEGRAKEKRELEICSAPIAKINPLCFF